MNKLCTLLTAALAALLLLTGCDASGHDFPENEEYHCAICLGAHVNNPVVNLALVEGEIYRACLSGGSVSLVVIDGQPFPLHIDIPAPEPGLSEAKYEQIASQYAAQIMETASKLHAQTKDVDTLQAVQLAARALESAESETGKPLTRELIIIDSCLSTRGTLSFVGSDIASLDPQQITDQLRQMEAIPNLQGLDVYVYSLGDVADKQDPLSQQERNNLKAIWETILSDSGAKVHMRADLPLTMTYDTAVLPDVTEIQVQSSKVDLTEAQKAGQELENEGKMVFSDEVIRFDPGSGVLTDAGQAAEQLSPVADYLCSSGERVLICGTTACWGGEDYCMELSQKRGEAIRDVLLGLGVAEEQMTVVPLGYGYADFYTNDQNPDGTLNDDLAPLNRNVYIVLGSSALGQDILAHAEGGTNDGI